MERLKRDPGSTNAACEWLASAAGSELLLWFGLSLIQENIQTNCEDMESIKQFLFQVMIQKHETYSVLILNKLIQVIIVLAKKMIVINLWSTFWTDVTGLQQISNNLFLKFILVMIEEFNCTKRDMKWADTKKIAAFIKDLTVPCLEKCLAILRRLEREMLTNTFDHGYPNISTGILGESPNRKRTDTQTSVYDSTEKLVLKVFSVLCQYIDVTCEIFPVLLQDLFRISMGSNISHSQLALSCLIEIAAKPYTPKGLYLIDF